MTRVPGEEHLPKSLKPTLRVADECRSVGVLYVEVFRPLSNTTKRVLDEPDAVYGGVLKLYFVPLYKKIARKYSKGVVIQEDRAKYHFVKKPTASKDLYKVRRL
jgi:hypothetical protein